MRKPDDPIASTDSGMDPHGGQSFYGRWSRRKRQAREGVLSDADRPGPAPVADEPVAHEPVAHGPLADEHRAGAPPAVRTDEPRAQDPAAPAERVLTDSDMPPLESLGENDDYSGFMSPGVSEGLRNLALRKLFHSSQYNVVDGLDDYADDFTHFEPLGDIITSDMRHQLELQAEREQREAEEKARAEAREEATAEARTETTGVPDEESAPGEQDAAADTAGAAEPAQAQAPDPDADGLTRAPDDGPQSTPDADPEDPRDV